MPLSAGLFKYLFYCCNIDVNSLVYQKYLVSVLFWGRAAFWEMQELLPSFRWDSTGLEGISKPAVSFVGRALWRAQGLVNRDLSLRRRLPGVMMLCGWAALNISISNLWKQDMLLLVEKVDCLWLFACNIVLAVVLWCEYLKCQFYFLDKCKKSSESNCVRLLCSGGCLVCCILRFPGLPPLVSVFYGINIRCKNKKNKKKSYIQDHQCYFTLYVSKTPSTSLFPARMRDADDCLVRIVAVISKDLL